MPAERKSLLDMTGMSVLTCGGTVTMRTDREGIRTSTRPDALTALVHTLAPTCEVTVRDLGGSDSASHTPKDWARIVRAVTDAVATNPGAPVVLTHGTDTLAWTAAALAVARDWPVPVVLTGANVPLDEPASDAAANLRCAITATGCAPGVYVAFAGSPEADGLVYQAGDVRKTSAGGTAFTGLPGPVAMTSKGILRQLRDPRPVPLRADDPTFPRRVAAIRCHPALDVELYRSAFAATRLDAVVIETYPCLTVGDDVVRLAAELVRAAVVVLAVPPSPVTDSVRYSSTGLLVDAGVRLMPEVPIELAVPYACGLAITA